MKKKAKFVIVSFGDPEIFKTRVYGTFPTRPAAIKAGKKIFGSYEDFDLRRWEKEGKSPFDCELDGSLFAKVVKVEEGDDESEFIGIGILSGSNASL